MAKAAEWLRTSLWFIPALFAVGAVLGALALVALDHQLQTSGPLFYVYGGTPEGARTMLSTIAQSMLTFTGLVFTITMLVLQQASSQLSPRVLRTFLSDRANQVVLGLFVATFVYTLVVLVDVRGGEASEEFVPGIATWVAFVLLLASVGAFVFYIDHMAHAIRASTVIANITRETHAAIERVYPDELDPAESAQRGPQDAPAIGPDWPVAPAMSSGYVTGIDDQALVAAAAARSIVIRVLPAVGEFVVKGMPLLRIRTDGQDDELANELRDRVSIGRERTMTQDVAYGFRQLVDIGARALSPGTNDPTTANQVIDSLHELLLDLVARPMPSPVRVDEAGAARVVLSEVGWPQLVDLAIDELRTYGASHVQVVRGLARLLASVSERASADRRQPLDVQLERLRAQVAGMDRPMRADLEAALIAGAGGNRPG